MSKPPYQYQYLAGYIVGLLLSLLLIHFLLANLFAQLLGISVWLSYTVLVALLLAWGVFHIQQVVRAKSAPDAERENANNT